MLPYQAAFHSFSSYYPRWHNHSNHITIHQPSYLITPSSPLALSYLITRVIPKTLWHPYKNILPGQQLNKSRMLRGLGGLGEGPWRQNQTHPSAPCSSGRVRSVSGAQVRPTYLGPARQWWIGYPFHFFEIKNRREWNPKYCIPNSLKGCFFFPVWDFWVFPSILNHAAIIAEGRCILLPVLHIISGLHSVKGPALSFKNKACDAFHYTTFD